MSDDMRGKGRHENPTAQDRRRSGVVRGVLTYIGVVAVLLIVTGGVYLAVRVFTAESTSPRLEAALEAARAAGVPMSWDEYWAGVEKEGPDGADYYHSAFAIFLEDPADLSSPFPPPPEGLPMLGRQPVAFPARGEEVPEDMKRRVADFLDANSASLEYLHSGAECTWSRYVTEWRGAETLLPHLSRVRACSRLLALAAWRDAVEGRAGAAVGRVEDGIAVSMSLKQEPFLISQMLRCASLSITLQSGLQQVLMHSDPSSADLAKLQRALEAAAADISLQDAFAGEIWGMPDLRDRVWGDEYQVFGHIANPSGPRKEPSFLERWRIKRGIDRFTAQNVEVALFFFEAAEKPTPELLTGKVPYRPKDPVTDPLFAAADHYPDAFHRALVSAANAGAKLEAAAAALAALRFRRETGRWPEALGELVPAFMAKVPSDPFTGDALIYRRLDDGLVIYSVGENGVDDGGGPSLVKPPEGGKDDGDDRGGFRLILPEGEEERRIETPEEIDVDFLSGAALEGAFEAAILEAEAMGLSTSGEELAKFWASVPPEENAALLYENAFAVMVDTGTLRTSVSLPIVGGGQLPDPSAPLSEETLAAIGDYVEANAEALALLHEGAALPRAAYSVEWKGCETMLPHLARARAAARLVTLAAWLEAENGNGDAALAHVSGALTLSGSLDAEPTVISDLVAGAIRTSTVSLTLERVLTRSHPSPEALRRLQDALAASAENLSMGESFTWEAAGYVDFYRRVRAGETDLLKSLFGIDAADADALKWLDTAPGAALKDLAEMANIARGSPVEIVRDAQNLLEEMNADPKRSEGWGMFVSQLPKALIALEKHRARLLSAAAAAAALRYHRDTGRFPESLDSLVPQYLGAAPLDPFTGKALRYEVAQDGIIVYSPSEAGEVDFARDAAGRYENFTGFRLKLAD